MKIDNGITKAASKNHGLSGFCAGSMLSPMWLGLERIDAHGGKLQNFSQSANRQGVHSPPYAAQLALYACHPTSDKACWTNRLSRG
jgi:hypothetical protein